MSTPRSAPARVEGNADATVAVAPVALETGAPVAAPGQPIPAAKKRSRHVSNEVRRAVVAREGYRCSYVDAHGNRCQQETFLQFHHRIAFARGGASTADQMTLLCSAHHAAQTELEFGSPYVQARIAARRRQPPPVVAAPAPGQPATKVRPTAAAPYEAGSDLAN